MESNSLIVVAMLMWIVPLGWAFFHAIKVRPFALISRRFWLASTTVDVYFDLGSIVSGLESDMFEQRYQALLDTVRKEMNNFVERERVLRLREEKLRRELKALDDVIKFQLDLHNISLKQIFRRYQIRSRLHRDALEMQEASTAVLALGSRLDNLESERTRWKTTNALIRANKTLEASRAAERKHSQRAETLTKKIQQQADRSIYSQEQPEGSISLAPFLRAEFEAYLVGLSKAAETLTDPDELLQMRRSVEVAWCEIDDSITHFNEIRKGIQSRLEKSKEQFQTWTARQQTAIDQENTQLAESSEKARLRYAQECVSAAENLDEADERISDMQRASNMARGLRVQISRRIEELSEDLADHTPDQPKL